jgi:hypothetical protein
MPSQFIIQSVLQQAQALGVDPRAILKLRRREVGAHDGDIWIFFRWKKFVTRRVFGFMKDWAFDEKDFVSLGKSREKLLRPLPDAFPAQVAMHNNRVILSVYEVN